MARIVMERADVLPMLGEVFREHGFEGASLAAITARTGLGKGSLYHFFPGGKEEMAAAVLAVTALSAGPGRKPRSRRWRVSALSVFAARSSAQSAAS